MDNSESEQSEHEEWSDDVCKDISSYDYFTSDVLDLEVQKNVITRFYNFYLGGKVPTNLSVSDLVFSVLSIMPLHVATEIPAWSEKEYGVNGTLFSLPLEDKEIANRNAASSSSMFQDHIRFFYYIGDEIASQTELIDDYLIPENPSSENVVIATEDEANNCQENVATEVIEIPDKAPDTVLEEESSEKVSTSFETSKSIIYSELKKDLRENINISYGKHKEYENFDLKTDKDNNTCKIFQDDETYNNFKLEDIEVASQSRDTSKEFHNTEVNDNSVRREEQSDKTKNQVLEMLKSDDNLKDLINTSTFNKWFGIKKKTNKEQIKAPQYDGTTNNAFIKCCNRLLGQWTTNQRARIVLKYFFGVVALTLMRGVTKSRKHIEQTFYGNKFLEDHIKYITKFSNIDYFYYSVPDKESIAICYRTFRKRDEKTRIMLAKLVTYSGFIDSQLPVRPIRGVPLWEGPQD